MSIRETNCVTDWIEIYTVDSVINLSINYGLVVKLRKNRLPNMRPRIPS